MSQTHIRVHSPEPTPKRHHWLEAFVIFSILFFTFGTAISILPRPPFDTEHETARGRILDSRIDIVGTEPWAAGTYGGSPLYQIQLHVKYFEHGQIRDRWLPGSKPSTSTLDLHSQLQHHPQTCQVFWLAEHPENAQCRFD